MAGRIAAVAVTCLLLVVRFSGVESTPSGFWLDEAAVATQSVCIAQTGRSAQGDFRLFTPLDAGFATPVTLGISALWVHLGGDSVGSFRVLAGLVGLVGLMGIGWAAYTVRGRRLDWPLAATLLLTSPWLFHLSRVYWDPIFAFALIGGALAMWGQWRESGKSPDAFFAGLCAGLAMVTYPPLYLSMPLTLVVLFAGPWRAPQTRRTAKAVVVGMGVGLVPLLATVGDSSFGARRGELAIWGKLNRVRMGWSWSDLPRVALENLFRHLNPSSLFLHGDANLRHSTGFGGVLSPAEGVAIAVAIGFMLTRSERVPARLVALIPVGFLPAALTWQPVPGGALPHYLRSIGAAAPLLLLAILGYEALIEKVQYKRSVAAVMFAALLTFFAFYAHDYFSRYSTESSKWFEASTIETWRSTGEWRRPEQPLARQYFEMVEGGRDCSSFQNR